MTLLQARVSAADLEILREKLELTANLPRGISAGMGAAIIGALAWAAVGVATGYRVSFMSLAVGILCGMTVRLMGRGVSIPFGIAGGVTTIVGCALGNVLDVAGIISGEQGIGLLDVLMGLDYRLAFDVIMAFAGSLDVFFYTLAVYEGYRLSIRPLTEAELALIIGRNPVGHPD